MIIVNFNIKISLSRNQQKINLKICLIYRYGYLWCFYENYKNNLQAICHFTNLILHESLLLVYFMLQIDWMEYPS